MLNSIVLCVASHGMGVLARGLGGKKMSLGIVNFLLAVCLAMAAVVSKLDQHLRLCDE